MRLDLRNACDVQVQNRSDLANVLALPVVQIEHQPLWPRQLLQAFLNQLLQLRSFQQQGTPQGLYTTVPLHSDIPSLVSQVYQTTNASQLQSLFTSLYTDINKEAATIPVVSGPNYALSSKCVTGINLNGFGANFAFASKTC